MAEIILPPEENEETPQVPELNIDKPTKNSKVITIEFEAKKTNKVSTKDTNQQLYTTDTDAWFEFKETSLEGANGTYSVVFRNRHDGSIFQRTGDVVNGVAYYKIPHQEIRHAGAWRGQIVYTLSNGDTTSREFDYDVKGHILDGKDVREIVVEDFETLMSQLRSMKDNAELELANLTQELINTTDTAEQNEADRQAFFDDLVEDINEFEENERQRQTNYQELLDTGVLQTNINTKLEQLEEEYAPKLTEVTAQLAHKADKKEVSDKRDKSLPIMMADLHTDVKTAMTGESVAVVGINAVGSENIKNKQVTVDKLGSIPIPEMIKGIEKINLYNKLEQVSGNIIDDTIIHGSNPPTTTTGVGFLSSKIHLVPGNIYTVTREKLLYSGGFAVVYDKNDNRVSNLVDTNTGPITFTMPLNGYYIRLALKSSGTREWRTDSFMLVPGSVLPTENIQYGAEFDWLKYRVKPQDLKNKPVTIETINGIEDIQLFNPSEQIVPNIIDNTWAINYTFHDNNHYFQSSKIYLIPGQEYVITKGFLTDTIHYGIAYNDNDEIVEWIVDSVNTSKDMVYTMNFNATYIRLSIARSIDLSSMQVIPGKIKPNNNIPYGGKIKWLKTLDDINIISTLPNKIYGVVGKEINIYFDNIIQVSDNIGRYQIDVVCDIGKQQKERWTSAPSTAGEYPITIKLVKDGYTTIYTITSTIVVKASNVGNGVSKSLLMLGDSVTDGGVITGELLNIFNSDAMDLTLLGVRGTTPNLHEGRSGAASWQYASSQNAGSYPNPFYNPSTGKFDMSYYMTNQGYSKLDYFCIHLGINDIFSDLTEVPATTPTLSAFDDIVNSVRAYDTNIKIGIGIVIPSGTQDGFANSYGSSRNYYKYRKNYFEYVNVMIEKFKDREDENIYLLPLNANIDTVNNYPSTSVPVNSRNSLTISRQTDPIHPSSSGKYQMSDVIYYWIKSFES